MILIAPKIFSTDLQPLIAHKNSHGVKTCLKTIEDITAAYDGRDAAEQVKYCIKDAIEQNSIRYVLLVGGMKPLSFQWYVPVRYAHLDDGSGHSVFLTDLYFADVYKNNGTEFEDWDSNGNGVFGEWGIGGDTLDLRPDVAVGRLPCRTQSEVKTVVKKIITYENTTYGQSWFKTMVTVGSDSFPASEGNEGEATCDAAASYMTNFTVDRLYVSTGALTKSEDVVNAVNAGCGFLMTRGKGGTDRVRMNDMQGSEFIALSNHDVSKLKNKDDYPVVVLGECIHGRFDVGVINLMKLLQKNPEYNFYDCVPECIAWRLIREKDAGAVAVVTNTNICYGQVGDADNDSILDDAEMYGGFLAVDLFRLYGQTGIDTLGLLHQQAVTDYIDQFAVQSDKIHCKSVQEFILFGDPSLQIGGYNQ
jgi:hypothetical protein